MEKKFLLYLLYIALVDIRERSYERNDKTTFGLCDLLHNIPLQLNSEKDIEEAYQSLCENVELKGITDWFNMRKEEFYVRYPEYKK